MDEQAAADASFSVLVSLLAGNNLVHDVGYLEAGLTTSPEMMVFTAEMIGMMRYFTAGFELNSETLALEVIHQVGQQGDYLSTDHTMNHFRTFWDPDLYNRQRMDEWTAEGKSRLGERLQEKTLGILQDHQSEPLPGEVKTKVRELLNAD